MAPIYLPYEVIIEIIGFVIKDDRNAYPYRCMRMVSRKFCVIASDMEICECSKLLSVRSSKQIDLNNAAKIIIPSHKSERNRIMSKMYVNNFMSAAAATRIVRAQMYATKYAKGTMECISFDTEWYTLKHDDRLVVCGTIKRAAALWRSELQKRIFEFSFFLRKPKADIWQIQLNRGHIQCVMQTRC
jgi:hypothetical protein